VGYIYVQYRSLCLCEVYICVRESVHCKQVKCVRRWIVYNFWFLFDSVEVCNPRHCTSNSARYSDSDTVVTVLLQLVWLNVGREDNNNSNYSLHLLTCFVARRVCSALFVGGLNAGRHVLNKPIVRTADLHAYCLCKAPPYTRGTTAGADCHIRKRQIRSDVAARRHLVQMQTIV